MKGICSLLFLMVPLIGLSQKQFEVFFDFNKDVPTEASLGNLKQWMGDNASAEITQILGYCDSVDDNQYNKELAFRRIKTVMALLQKNSMTISDKVVLKSVGEDFKFSKNQSENRKVVLWYTEKPPAEIKNSGTEKDSVFSTVSDLVKQEKSKLAGKFAKAKKGDLIRINNIIFYFNAEKIEEKSMPLLEELLQIMKDNPKLRIEIQGHICCNPNPQDTKLSYRRAIVIFKYLVNNGIPVGRLSYKGFGSNNPIYKVPERNEKERAANRRVEILIVEKE